MDYGLALLSGVLLALSFPKFGHPAFAWIALVPLFIALAGWRRVGHARGRALNDGAALGLSSGEGQGVTSQRAFMRSASIWSNASRFSAKPISV